MAGPQGPIGPVGPQGATGASGAAAPFRVLMSSGGTVLMRSLPAAATLFGSTTGYIQSADLTNYTQVRLYVNRMAGTVAGARLLLRYSTVWGTIPSSFASLSATAGTEAQVDIAQPNAINASGWFNLPAAAKTVVFLAPITSNGDGRADFEFGSIVAEFR